MRFLIAYAGHPWLYRSAQWKYVRQLAESNPNDYFHIVVSDKAVVTDGEIKNATVHRSSTDTNYFFYRDIGSLCSINDGKYVVDAALTITSEMAAGVDLAVNQRGFTANTYNIPVVVWHHMFHAVKDPRWREMTAMFPSVYCSSDEYRLWTRYLNDRYKPSVVREILDRSAWFPFIGKDLIAMSETAKTVEKFERPTVLFGARFNGWHDPDHALEIIESLYRIGVDFDAIITTPDKSVDQKYVDRISAFGGTLKLECGMDEFHRTLMRCHAGLITGKAAGPAWVPEFLAGGTILVADRPHCVYDEVQSLTPPYPWSFSGTPQAVLILKKIMQDPAGEYAKFHGADYSGQVVRTMDCRVFATSVVDWMRGLARSFRVKCDGGTSGSRARIVVQLAEAGGEATLSEMLKITERSGTTVHDEQIGRWVTAKLVHDVLVSNPAVVDLCDGPEPRYVLNFDLFRKWRATHDIAYSGPSEVPRVVGTEQGGKRPKKGKRV